MNRTFKLAQVRRLLNQVHSEEITFSKLVEELNCRANIKSRADHERLVERLDETSASLLQITQLAKQGAYDQSDLDEAYNAFDSATQLLTELMEDKS